VPAFGAGEEEIEVEVSEMTGTDGARDETTKEDDRR
jgi:hypothetical protein